MEHQLYFAYGSNLLPRQMAERCPGAKPVARAVLPGYRFLINARGVATIATMPQGKVCGVVWRISRWHERILDGYEGVSAGAYGKHRVRVRYGNHRDASTLTYIDPIADCGLPREGYLTKVIAGAKFFDLPTRYIDDLYLWGTLEGHEQLATG